MAWTSLKDREKRDHWTCPDCGFLNHNLDVSCQNIDCTWHEHMTRGCDSRALKDPTYFGPEKCSICGELYS